MLDCFQSGRFRYATGFAVWESSCNDRAKRGARIGEIPESSFTLGGFKNTLVSGADELLSETMTEF